MSLTYKDRVQELTRTTGTSAYVLSGAVTGYQSFQSVGDGNTCYYTASDGIAWEVGLGTYSTGSSTLDRTTILASSNAGAAVHWGLGVKIVWLDFPASVAAHLYADTPANYVLAGPASGSSALPAYRHLVGADLPLQGVYDPADYGADQTGAVDGYAAWQAMLTEAIAAAPSRNGVVYIKPSPGTYLINWNGQTGYSVLTESFPGSSLTGVNQRSCFVINNAAVTALVLDFTGCTIMHGGTNWTQWATMFTGLSIENVFVIGATLDYVNLPNVQGAVTVIGASTCQFQIDPNFNSTPSFTTAFRIDQMSAFSYSKLQPVGPYPIAQAVDISPFVSSPVPLTLTDLGAGLYEIGGLSSDQIIALNALTPAGTNIVTFGATGGPAWFKFIMCGHVHYQGVTCHASGAHWALNDLCRGGTTYDDCHVIPRSGAWMTGGRGNALSFDSGGTHSFSNTCEFQGIGDDAIAVIGSALTLMTQPSAGVLRGFSNGNFYGQIPPQTHFIMYNASHVQVCAGVVTSVGLIQADFKRDYTVTIASGSIPADMTGHIAPFLEYRPVTNVDQTRVSNVRGRFVYYEGPGEVNVIGNNSSDEGVVAQSTKGGELANYTGGADIRIGGILTGCCRNGFYPAAVRVFASKPTDSQVAALNYPYADVTISAQIHDCNGMAVLLAGVDRANLTGMLVDNISLTAPYVGSEAYSLGFVTRTTVGIINCRDVESKDDNKFNRLNGSGFVTPLTADGGANASTGGGSTAYNLATSTVLSIQSDSTLQAVLELRNASLVTRVFSSAFGIFLQDVTNGRTPWNLMNTSGHMTPNADNLYNFGSVILRINSGYIRALFFGAGSAFLSGGAGSPEGVVTAPVSSIWMRSDGGAGTVQYIKESGSGNTGWVAK